FRQLVDESRHDRILAQARLIITQRLGQVIRILPAKLWVVGDRTVAVQAVASLANLLDPGPRGFGIGGIAHRRETKYARGEQQLRNGSHHRSLICSRSWQELRRNKPRGRQYPCPTATSQWRASTDGCAPRSGIPAAPSQCTPRAGRRAWAPCKPRETPCASRVCRDSRCTSGSSASRQPRPPQAGFLVQ